MNAQSFYTARLFYLIFKIRLFSFCFIWKGWWQSCRLPYCDLKKVITNSQLGGAKNHLQQFNCALQRFENWQKIAQKIFQSKIKLKKDLIIKDVAEPYIGSSKTYFSNAFSSIVHPSSSKFTKRESHQCKKSLTSSNLSLFLYYYNKLDFSIFNR